MQVKLTKRLKLASPGVANINRLFAAHNPTSNTNFCCTFVHSQSASSELSALEIGKTWTLDLAVPGYGVSSRLTTFRNGRNIAK
jgi:hypothetical protein